MNSHASAQGFNVALASTRVQPLSPNSIFCKEASFSLVPVSCGTRRHQGKAKTLHPNARKPFRCSFESEARLANSVQKGSFAPSLQRSHLLGTCSRYCCLSSEQSVPEQVKLESFYSIELQIAEAQAKPKSTPLLHRIVLAFQLIPAVSCLLLSLAILSPLRKQSQDRRPCLQHIRVTKSGLRDLRRTSPEKGNEVLLTSEAFASSSVFTDVPSLDVNTQDLKHGIDPRSDSPRQVVLVSAASVDKAKDTHSTKINEKELRKWMEGLKKEALEKGVKEQVFSGALKGVRPLPQVIEKDRNQPEFKLTCEAYLERMVTAHRLKLGKDMMSKHRQLLQDVSAKYGVPESIIVAIWGMESSYGNFMGTWDVVAALVSLAYDKEQPSRAKYFREELINSLFILQDGHATIDTMRGSWAGAMGQCQFMPSSFRNFAVDFDGDGKADIWTSTADVLASIANYLVKHGWKAGQPYFEKVALPEGIKPDLLGLKVTKPVGEWRDEYGVKPPSETPALPSDCLASLVAPDGVSGPSYLVSGNISVVLRYNKSLFYALAVGHIAEDLGPLAPAECSSQTEVSYDKQTAP